MKITMKQGLDFGKFVMAVVAIIVAYRVATGLGRTIVDREDETMDPAVKPGQWVWCSKNEWRASQLRNGDIIIYRHPKEPGEIYIARVKGLPGDTVDGRIIPRGHVWVLLDNLSKKPDSRTFGPLSEHFIKGKAIWLRVLPRDGERRRR